MDTRVWTLQEANDALPAVRGLLAQARAAWRALADAQEHMRDLLVVHGERVHDADSEGHLEFRDHVEAAEQAHDALQAALARFVDMGVEVKDVESGLVDFRSELGGRQVYLCWRDGEAGVAHWHTLRGGFAGRMPVPRVELE